MSDSTTTPAQYSAKIQVYTEQFPIILDNFKTAYINHNKTPEYEEYTQLYDTNKAALNTVNGQLFSTINDIQKNIDILNKNTMATDTKLMSLKDNNKKLVQKMTQIRGSNNGAKEMINNSKELYKTQYTINVSIFVGILLICIMMYHIFRSSSYSSSSSSSPTK
jgi:hypothetical protein